MIETERLTLRPWRDGDRPAFRAMGRDPCVMRYLGGVQDDAAADAGIDRQIAMQAGRGHCFWAIERRADRRFLGFCGLKIGPDDTPIGGEIEIGWRLAHDAWGQGYAREAAEASLAWGWVNLPVPRISAMTVPDNVASWGLMQRIGMERIVDGDFDHPALPEDSPLRRHILYRIARPA